MLEKDFHVSTAEVLPRVHCGLTVLGGQKEHSLPSQMVESGHSEIAEYNFVLFTSFSSLDLPQLCYWEHWNKAGVGMVGKSMDLYCCN